MAAEPAPIESNQESASAPSDKQYIRQNAQSLEGEMVSKSISPPASPIFKSFSLLNNWEQSEKKDALLLDSKKESETKDSGGDIAPGIVKMKKTSSVETRNQANFEKSGDYLPNQEIPVVLEKPISK